MAKHDWESILYELYLTVTATPKEESFSWRKLSTQLRINEDTLRGKMKELGYDLSNLRALESDLKLQQQAKVNEAAIVFADKKDVEDVNWREFVDLAETARDLEHRIEQAQRIAEVKINTDKPFAIMFTSDWHLGDKGTDHARWSADIEFVLSASNLGMIDLGDDRQNMRKFFNLAGVLGQVLSPKQQALMLRSVVDELTKKDKLIAKIGGNHDEEFDERIFGQAIQHYLLENMAAPRFRNRGLIKLTVGSELYSVLVFHKSRFKSFLRRTHGAMREHQLSFPADVIAGGHDHEPGMEHLYHYNLAREAGFDFGGETLLIKTGTYQDSDYGWRYFHGSAPPQNYTVVFYPDQHKMVPFTRPRDAVIYMEAIK
jgi:hypothetical protein